MLSLVQDAGIKDIARDPMKARDFVKERFCLDETEERAAHRFASRIFDSIKAIMPEVMERIHTVLQVGCSAYFIKYLRLLFVDSTVAYTTVAISTLDTNVTTAYTTADIVCSL
ncbi:unnamed protein product [Hydatigera taeniaeformis]|uniref:ABC transmembrane type-1 domain-containing protein n=1 Tax=Hydatigena taeniaeformis TaxID=6205 RepID=A0A0R3WVP2_HYDTA|nr:unnamed protein product [Hydatigera taeniaeformis]